MAWIDRPRGHYRIRDRIDGEICTVVKNAGRWKEIAMARLLEYEKGKAAGTAGDLLPASRLPVGMMCDLNLEHYGPRLKGGKSDHYRAAYYGYRLRMEQIKRAWPGRYADEISDIEVGQFLAQFETPGTGPDVSQPE
jgi:hypothetical protein